MKTNNKLKYQVTAGVVLIIVGIALLLINFINDKRDQVFSDMNLALTSALKDTTNDTSEEENNDTITTTSDTSTSDSNSNDSTYVYEPYLGEIEIPKISLRKGFYSKESNLNNVKFNLYVMPTSSYPDVQNGNFIIAGHSGNYNNSYFKDNLTLINIPSWIVVQNSLFIPILKDINDIIDKYINAQKLGIKHLYN